MNRIERHADAMGSTFSIILYGEDETRMEEAVDAAFSEALRLDDLLSNYKVDSEWSQINRRAMHEPVAVTPELFHLLSNCLQYSRWSEGAFDITVGPLMKAWGFYKADGCVPGPAELAQARACCGYRHLVLDHETRTVRFAVAGLELDPGGIGKGYSVDRMAAILKQREFAAAFVAAGRSSLYGLGAPPTESRGWPVQLGSTRETVFLKDSSVSTSGSFEKFFYAAGKMYCHLLDPRTGYPLQGISLVSVIAPFALDSEAWTKPCLIHGPAWAAKHLPPQGRALFS